MAERRIHRMKVLIVDDNHHMVNIVKTILRGLGLKDFFDARSPIEALELLRTTPVDLIITDYAMEPVDGFQFVKKLRAAEDNQTRFVPVIMLTAYSEKSRVEAARDSGVNEFCTKPVTAEELYKKVRSIVNHPRTFVRTKAYFGPDRRRRDGDHFEGEERRDADRDETVEPPAPKTTVPV